MAYYVPFVFGATILFVFGQAMLKTSHLSTSTTTMLFMVTMGVSALAGWLLFGRGKDAVGPLPMTAMNVIPAALAGIAFAVGNMLWIMAIKASPNIGFVRILMAGLETSLLLLVAWMAFAQKVTLKQATLTAAGMVLLFLAVL